MPGTRQHHDPVTRGQSSAREWIASLGPRERARVGWMDRFGFRPPRQGLREARKAIVGRGATPATEWDLSSLKIFKPRISIHTWAGRTRADGMVPVYNFVNRNRPPRSAPYSVKVSICRDFQGGQWTYDSHVGTDFAVPVGTPIVTTAPGLVVRVDRELDHGGLKVCTDHGQSLFSTSSHLSRALVHEGERIDRGQVIGLSGASGIEFILFFPWVAPHLHLNVWMNGEPIDPFALGDEVSMWRRRNDPGPYDGTPAEDEAFEPSEWNPEGVKAAIAACRDGEIREKARRFESLERRAAEILFHRVLSSAVFDDFPPLYRREGARRPCLDLPFRKQDFKGAWLPRAKPL